MVAVPDLMSAYQRGVIDARGRQGRAARGDLALRADGRPGRGPRPAAGADRAADARLAAGRGRLRLAYAALYYPWIKVFDPATGTHHVSPPSGHVAGVWARNDAERGVHKAPANEVIRGAVDLETQLSKGEQDLLNPIGVNCMRAFPGRGIRVWGARTLSSDPAWRYLNVRRLFNYLEESILLGTQWVVFEPNDDRLWSSIRRNITAFLTERVAPGRAVRPHRRGGVLRQVRPGEQPAGVHRPRPGHLRDRRRAGQAGRVRGLPAVAVLRQHQPRQRVISER